ncbi:MAG: hypothetical protein ACI85Q_002890 [Salibacteraceae bacterium]|jgi:hypothetical protein
MNNSQLVNTTNRKSDLFGVAASSLCLVHCLATPLIFVVQACTKSCCEAGPWWWSMIDYLFLIISLVAIFYSAKTTSLKWMPFVLYLSWGILALLIFHERFPYFEIPHMAVYVPAFSLVFLHLYNRKYCVCEKEKCCVN